MGGAAFAASGPAAPQAAATGSTASVVVFGDSITAAVQQSPERRWPAILEQRLRAAAPGRGLSVVNAGAGGNTSREGLARIERDVLARKPDVVTVEFGGNDATDVPNRHVDLAEFGQNLSSIVTRVRSVSPDAAIIMLTFPPVIDSRHSRGTMHGGLDRYVEQYRESVRTFASSRGLRLVDTDAAIRPRAEQLILPDGVHLTAEGNQAIADAVFPAVRDALGIPDGDAVLKP